MTTSKTQRHYEKGKDWSIDIFYTKIEDRYGHNCYLAILDMSTRLAITRPLETLTTEHLIDSLTATFIELDIKPKNLTLDEQPAFTES